MVLGRNIGRNRLSGTIPGIADVPLVEYLDFSYNMFSGRAPDITRNSFLLYLFLQRNRLTTFIDAARGGLLRELWAAPWFIILFYTALHWLFSSFEPSTIWGLPLFSDISTHWLFSYCYKDENLSLFSFFLPRFLFVLVLFYFLRGLGVGSTTRFGLFLFGVVVFWLNTQ